MLEVSRTSAWECWADSVKSMTWSWKRKLLNKRFLCSFRIFVPEPPPWTPCHLLAVAGVWPLSNGSSWVKTIWSWQLTLVSLVEPVSESWLAGRLPVGTPFWAVHSDSRSSTSVRVCLRQCGLLPAANIKTKQKSRPLLLARTYKGSSSAPSVCEEGRQGFRAHSCYWLL